MVSLEIIAPLTALSLRFEGFDVCWVAVDGQLNALLRLDVLNWTLELVLKEKNLMFFQAHSFTVFVSVYLCYTES